MLWNIQLRLISSLARTHVRQHKFLVSFFLLPSVVVPKTYTWDRRAAHAMLVSLSAGFGSPARQLCFLLTGSKGMKFSSTAEHNERAGKIGRKTLHGVFLWICGSNASHYGEKELNVSSSLILATVEREKKIVVLPCGVSFSRRDYCWKDYEMGEVWRCSTAEGEIFHYRKRE